MKSNKPIFKVEVHYQSHEQFGPILDSKVVYDVIEYRVHNTRTKEELILKLTDGTTKKVTLYYEYTEGYATYKVIK